MKRREPVPYLVAVAHLLRRIESVPCRETVPLVALTERPPTAADVRPPEPSEPPARAFRRNERPIRSVVDGSWVIVTTPNPMSPTPSTEV